MWRKELNAQNVANLENSFATHASFQCQKFKTLFHELKYLISNFLLKFNALLIASKFLFQLPIKIDIVKHRQEMEGKSTSAHAAIIAADQVSVFRYPTNIPKYPNDGKV